MAELLTLTRMSRRASLPSACLKDLAETGGVPSLRVGNRFLFNPEAVIAALSRLAAEPPVHEDARRAEGGEDAE